MWCILLLSNQIWWLELRRTELSADEVVCRHLFPSPPPGVLLTFSSSIPHSPCFALHSLPSQRIIKAITSWQYTQPESNSLICDDSIIALRKKRIQMDENEKKRKTNETVKEINLYYLDVYYFIQYSERHCLFSKGCFGNVCDKILSHGLFFPFQGKESN